jgi:hypothetical protein
MMRLVPASKTVHFKNENKGETKDICICMYIHKQITERKIELCPPFSFVEEYTDSLTLLRRPTSDKSCFFFPFSLFFLFSVALCYKHYKKKILQG